MSLRSVFSKSSPSRDRFASTFGLGFRVAVFSVLDSAVQRLRRKNLRDYDEIAITGELVHQLRGVVGKLPFTQYGFLLAVHDDAPVHGNSPVGKKRLRIDLQIEQVSTAVRPRFSFEAKRLCRPEHKSASSYVGPEGVGSFVSGEYAPEAPWGGMLAYVETGSVKDWLKLIRTRISSNAHLRLRSAPNWVVPSHVLKAVELHSSFHRRVRRRDIEVLHGFIDLTHASTRGSAEKVPASGTSTRRKKTKP